MAVDQRVSAPPQAPNPAYVKAREGPIAEPLQDYEKLRTRERPQDISLDNYATPMQEDETYDIVIWWENTLWQGGGALITILFIKDFNEIVRLIVLPFHFEEIEILYKSAN